MKLHNNKESFNNLISIISDYYKIDAALIEKDYYVTLVLKELTNSVPTLIFKGGTSLSKCFKIIDRFSEDIDLTLESDFQTQGQKKKMKNSIIETCLKLELHIQNVDAIRSRRDYNCYKVEYPIKYSFNGIRPLLLIETTYITKSYPCEKRYATSIVYDYLYETGNVQLIKKYELQPFEIKVQSLERTLVDKVFAICDYYTSKRIERNSRHIYDISKILTKVKIDESLRELVSAVREERSQLSSCFSAKDGVSINKILKDIIDTEIYKKDLDIKFQVQRGYYDINNAKHCDIEDIIPKLVKKLKQENVNINVNNLGFTYVVKFTPTNEGIWVLLRIIFTYLEKKYGVRQSYSDNETFHLEYNRDLIGLLRTMGLI